MQSTVTKPGLDSPKTRGARQGAPKTANAPAADALGELWPGQSVALLQELHILTRDGKLNQDSRRKLKQVYHLYRFIEKPLLELALANEREGGKGVTLADHGAGKSYLGFIISDLFFGGGKHAAHHGRIYGIETRAELVERSTELAQKLGFDNMSFLNLSAADAAHSAALPETIDMVTALHACDTATDDAIAFGLARHAKYMAIVPCCQAEVASCLRESKALSLARTPLAELWRHPLHTREFGSQITNVLRCLHLESHGYQVTVTELVGWEHSMKNELIIARHTGQKNRAAAERLGELLAQFGLADQLKTRFPSA